MKYVSVLLGFVLIFTSCSKKEREDLQKVTSIKTGDIIKLKSVVSHDVKELKRLESGFELVGEEDKTIMLDFFGTFCPPCKEEAAFLSNLQIKNNKDFVLLAFTSFENVSDKYIVDNFVDKYGAYYFISNDKQNEDIANLALKDIFYAQQMQLPFKVVLKRGKYQNLTDVWGVGGDIKYYIGAVGMDMIQKDLDRIKRENESK